MLLLVISLPLAVEQDRQLLELPAEQVAQVRWQVPQVRVLAMS